MYPRRALGRVIYLLKHNHDEKSTNVDKKETMLKSCLEEGTQRWLRATTKSQKRDFELFQSVTTTKAKD